MLVSVHGCGLYCVSPFYPPDSSTRYAGFVLPAVDFVMSAIIPDISVNKIDAIILPIMRSAGVLFDRARAALEAKK